MEQQNNITKKSKHIYQFTAPITQKHGSTTSNLSNLHTTIKDTQNRKHTPFKLMYRSTPKTYPLPYQYMKFPSVKEWHKKLEQDTITTPDQTSSMEKQNMKLRRSYYINHKATNGNIKSNGLDIQTLRTCGKLLHHSRMPKIFLMSTNEHVPYGCPFG
jgi:archaellin